MMDPDKAVLALVKQAIGEKALLWAALLACFAVWGFTLYDPQPFRLGAAGAFTVLVYLPLLHRSKS